MPCVVKAIATIFENHPDWFLYIKEDDGQVVKKRQSILFDEGEVPEWLETFWEQTSENLKTVYDIGDVVHSQQERQ